MSFDVTVVGGGPAGLSAAIALARSLRSVVVVDAGAPRNRFAAGAHNVLTRDGTAPADLVRMGRAELATYGGRVVTATATGAARDDDGFHVRLDNGDELISRGLVVASGLVDELPDVPGLADRWGRDVLHCPYCHGWEVRGQRIGVLATNAAAGHQALLFSQLSDDVVVFTHTAAPLDDAITAQLQSRGVRFVTGTVVGVETDADRLSGIRLADGTVVARDALVVAPRAVARSVVLDDLGLPSVPHPMGADYGSVYPSEVGGTTTIPLLNLAGNVTDSMGQVMASAAQGVLAGAQLNMALIMAEIQTSSTQAVPTR